MQVLQNSKIVDDEEKKDVLLEIIADKYCRQIISSIVDGKKSVPKISKETNIPISTVYRKIQKLEEQKLLDITGLINDEGKKIFLYSSRIRSISSQFDSDSVTIQIITNYL